MTYLIDHAVYGRKVSSNGSSSQKATQQTEIKFVFVSFSDVDIWHIIFLSIYS